MYKKLYRSTNNRVIAGVCQGLADYFNVDVALVRVIFLLTAIFGGTGLVAYIVLWVVVPEEIELMHEEIEEPAPTTHHTKHKPHRAKKDAETLTIQTPEGDSNEEPAEHTPAPIQKKRTDNLLAFILIILGAIFLAENFLPSFSIARLWPVIIIVIGISLLFDRKRS